MAARLVFLGRLADIAGGSEREVPAGPFAAIAETLDAELSGPRVRFALNGAVIAEVLPLVLADGDELAFLPPVSGG